MNPGANEVVNLNFKTKNFSVDPSSEQEMADLVNNERISKGFAALIADTKLTEVARDHCKDMFARGYFSHYTPEGLSHLIEWHRPILVLFMPGKIWRLLQTLLFRCRV